ncbi:MAG: Plug domain-containing protein, partial [Bacteroidota bacterium]
FSDTLDLLLQSNFDINKTSVTDVDLSTYQIPFWEFEDRFDNEDDTYKMLSHKVLKTAHTYDSLLTKLDTTQQAELAKIEVQSHTKLYNDRPDARIVLDTMAYLDKMTSVTDVLKRVPGVVVSGEEGLEKFQVRGTSTKPTYYLNGFKTNLDDLRKFPLNDIAFVDVIRGPRTAAFGTLGEDGVVLVYTKEAKVVSGILNTKVNGFHKAREFAVFDSEWLGDQKLSDIRTTLHWNPDLRTDDKGKVKESFTTSDQTGEFIIIAQGLRDDGTPFYGTKKIVVKK